MFVESPIYAIMSLRTLQNITRYSPLTPGPETPSRVISQPGGLLRSRGLW
jgi:hypothetical protein